MLCSSRYVFVLVIALVLSSCMGEVNKQIRLRASTISVPSTNPEHSLDQPLQIGSSGSGKKLYLLTLEDAGDMSTKDRIEAIIGHPLTSYIPDDTFTIFSTPAAAKSLQAIPHVVSIIPFLPQWKLASIAASTDGTTLYGLVFEEASVDISDLVTRCNAMLQQHNLSSTATEAGSSKLSVSVPVGENSRAVAELLSAIEEITWVEVKPKVHILNTSSAARGFNFGF
eukprot:GILK01004085.1.p1 GENE.GILK01004085.1~~GILK01004085.1.p1  ORF type:complete len:226 (-),score=25.25 GILK01004085.1:54-731(-)